MGKVQREVLQEAMRMLGRKPYSCRGMILALEKKGYSDGEIARAVERLKEWDYLSDERFAEERIAHYRRMNKGRLFVEYRMIEEGLESAKARELLECWYPELEEMKRAQELTAARFAVGEPLPAERIRWCRTLASAGFSPRAIEACGYGDVEA